MYAFKISLAIYIYYFYSLLLSDHQTFLANLLFLHHFIANSSIIELLLGSKLLSTFDLALWSLFYYFLSRIFVFTNCYICVFCYQKYLSKLGESICFLCNHTQILDGHSKSVVCFVCLNYGTNSVFVLRAPAIFAALPLKEQIWILKEGHSNLDAISCFYQCFRNDL